jgi:hypothetical protein
MTKADLHELVERLPDEAVDGAAILLREVTDGRIDPDQAWFWSPIQSSDAPDHLGQMSNSAAYF